MTATGDRPGRRAVGLRVLMLGAGALTARLVLDTLRAAPGSQRRWARTNYRGASVSLAGGPALAAAASATAAAGARGPAAAAAALTAGLGSGAVGLYDDVVGRRPQQRVAKGFHGHLAALRRGRVTSGVVKLAGAGAAGLVAAALLEVDQPRRSGSIRPDPPGDPRASSLINASGGWRRTAANVVLGAGVVAGAANLTNLLDLRPGRALKVAMLVGAPLAAGRTGGLAAGPVGAGAALLPADLAEQIMLGDSGANALGALLGVALAARSGPAGRAALLTLITGLTVASERVSFTRVIATTPVLRELDALGRRT